MALPDLPLNWFVLVEPRSNVQLLSVYTVNSVFRLISQTDCVAHEKQLTGDYSSAPPSSEPRQNTAFPEVSVIQGFFFYYNNPFRFDTFKNCLQPVENILEKLVPNKWFMFGKRN